MRFIVSSNILLKQLQVLGGVINSNNTLPILDNFLFELDKNTLQISASDLETTMVSTIEVESEDTAVIAVSARLLLDTLKTFPSQPLTFKTKKIQDVPVDNAQPPALFGDDDDELESEEDNNLIEIISEQGNYDMAYFDGTEFPKMVELQSPSKAVMPPHVLGNAISKTLIATGNDDMRPIMSGVFFQFSPNNLTFVATDAHKLVRYTRTDLNCDQEAEFVMPKKTLSLLKGVLVNAANEVEVTYDSSNAKFTIDNLAIICRLIDGKYPNYEAVIPKENPNKLVLDRSLFLNTVKRVSIFSDKATHQVRLKMAGKALTVFAQDFDFATKADERLDCNYQGDDMEIGFNAKFLAELLANLNASQVSIEMSLPSRAGILTPLDNVEEGENITMLVMPVTLSN